MFNRQKQQGDPPQVVAAKRASLAIAWGIAVAPRVSPIWD